MITMGIKKACGNEAIGDNVRPDGLITIFFISVGKGTEKIWNRQIFLGKSWGNMLKNIF